MAARQPLPLILSILGLAGFLLMPERLAARHIVGGEIFYECLGPGSQQDTRDYRLTMKIYRDCAGFGADFDRPARVGVYSHVNGIYMFRRMLEVNHGAVTRLTSSENPCLILPPNVCVEESFYLINLINLPLIEGSYFVSWQRCCRNNTISNIVDPMNTGATYTIEITEEAQFTMNNGPRFNNFPDIGICVNDPIDFDHSAFDDEGDEIIYEFCAPLEGGGPLGVDNPSQQTFCNGITPDPRNCLPPYTPVTFRPPNYSLAAPLGTTSSIAINPATGRITGLPTITGQFVVGVCAKEYRNGILMSVLRRDFQYNVVNCETAVDAVIEADAVVDGKEFVLNSCGNNTVTFQNKSQIEQFIKNYRWTFDLNGEIKEVTTRNATITFPGIGSYSGTMIVNEGEQCGDTAYINVNIYPTVEADFEFDYDTCIGGPVSFQDLSSTNADEILEWDWAFGDNEYSENRNPNHLYQEPGMHPVSLVVTDNNACKDTARKAINYFPVPPLIIIKPTSFTACVPQAIRFNNLSVPIDETYDIQWQFGDGGTGDEISPLHVYNERGTYTVTVDITSPIGCFASATFPNLITMEPSPTAGFTFSPETVSNLQSEVVFTDQSTLANGHYWDFGGEARSFERNPVYMFKDTGIYEVMQVVFHENGCTDTMIHLIDVEPVVQYFLPNAFTPNNDGKNEFYKPKGLSGGVNDYLLSIWTRWGDRVFESRDPEVGWNGRRNNLGDDLPVGVYLCVLQYTDARQRMHELKEFVTLIR